jgi:hypothetical protein
MVRLGPIPDRWTVEGLRNQSKRAAAATTRTATRRPNGRTKTRMPTTLTAHHARQDVRAGRGPAKWSASAPPQENADCDTRRTARARASP